MITLVLVSEAVIRPLVCRGTLALDAVQYAEARGIELLQESPMRRQSSAHEAGDISQAQRRTRNSCVRAGRPSRMYALSAMPPSFALCSIYATRKTEEWEAGRGYSGGSQRQIPGETPHEILRAIDIHTGKIAWESPETGPASSWGGTLGFASGITLVASDGGMFSAVDTLTGKLLWQFQTNAAFKASPMTYMFDGKQYVTIAAGQNVFAFGLLE